KAASGNLFDFSDTAYITVKDLILDGNQTSLQVVTINKTDHGSQNIIIDNCELENSAINGMLVGSNYNQILNSRIHDNGLGSSGPGYGIYMVYGYNVINKNDIHHNGRYGIHLYTQNPGLTNNTITNNKIHDNTQKANGSGIIVGGSNHLIYNNII